MEGIIKAIGWPHLAFLFAVFFVLLFKKPLFGLISRITAVDKSGIKASQAPEAQREEQKKEAVQQLLLAIGDSIKVLIKHLAATRVLLEFEQIHNLIFGSQIFLLKKLNEVAGQGKPVEFVATHFEHVKGLFPEQLSEWSLEQYLAFLIGRLLVTTKGNVFHITNLGVEYLTWMVRNGKREDNPL
jgi:hypothetical protein